MMTTMAAIMGAIPIALGFGADVGVSIHLALLLGGHGRVEADRSPQSAPRRDITEVFIDLGLVWHPPAPAPMAVVPERVDRRRHVDRQAGVTVLTPGPADVAALFKDRERHPVTLKSQAGGHPR